MAAASPRPRLHGIPARSLYGYPPHLDGYPRLPRARYADKESIFRTDATFYRDASGQRTDVAASTLEQAESDFVEDQKKLLDQNPARAAVRNAQSKPATPAPDEKPDRGGKRRGEA